MGMGGPTGGGEASEVGGPGGRGPPGGRLAELYRLHADAAVRLAYLLTGDAGLAQDLVQDAFVRLAGRLVHLRDRNAFPAYLRATVLNLARMQFRKERRERASLERQASLRQPEPAERDLGETEAMRVQLLRLTERQRAAVVLRFYEDLTDSQAAQVLGCAPGTVRSLVSRAMETLRQEVQR
jgi:RNA polymerase sigma factor (sigma-70 family)